MVHYFWLIECVILIPKTCFFCKIMKLTRGEIFTKMIFYIVNVDEMLILEIYTHL